MSPKVRAVATAAAAVVVAMAGLHFACSSSDPVEPLPATADADASPTTRDAQPDRAPTGDDAAIDAGFLTDPALWTPVPNDLGCDLFEGRFAKDPFPEHVWTSCGEGCSVAPATLPVEGAIAVVANQSVGQTVGGETFLNLREAYRPEINLQRLVRLSDGATVGAVQVRGPSSTCGFGGGIGDAAFLVAVVRTLSSGNAGWTFGRMPSSPGERATWQSSSITSYVASSHRFMFASGGHGLAFSTDEVGMLGSSQATAFVFPDAGTTQTFDIAARGNLLAVARFSPDGGGLVQGIAPDASVSTLLETSDETPVAIASDGQRLVWVAAGGSPAFRSSGIYATTRLGVASLLGGTLAPVAWGPTLATTPTTSANRSLAFHGDYAALISCPEAVGSAEPTCNLQVIQLSTKKLWTLGSRPGGNTFGDVLAISGTEVVLSEFDHPSHPPFGNIHRIVRLELSALDSIGW